MFTPDGKPLGSGSVPSQQHHPHEGWVEKDPDEQWAGAQRAIAKAVEEAGVEGSDIAAIGTTGHGDGLYTLDAGSPTSPPSATTPR